MERETSSHFARNCVWTIIVNQWGVQKIVVQGHTHLPWIISSIDQRHSLSEHAAWYIGPRLLRSVLLSVLRSHPLCVGLVYPNAVQCRSRNLHEWRNLYPSGNTSNTTAIITSSFMDELVKCWPQHAYTVVTHNRKLTCNSVITWKEHLEHGNILMLYSLNSVEMIDHLDPHFEQRGPSSTSFFFRGFDDLFVRACTCGWGWVIVFTSNCVPSNYLSNVIFG